MKNKTHMKVVENADLTARNSLGVRASAEFLVEIDTIDHVREFLDESTLASKPAFILGGGSNTVIRHDIEGVVIHPKFSGIAVKDEDDSSVLLEVGAGENWHSLVEYCVEQGWAGIENLALIPGDMGGAPVQNIAAYGHNFSDVFDSLEAVDLKTGEVIRFGKDECEFGYRSSVFKTSLQHKVLITRVHIRLNKVADLNTSYFSIGGRYDSVERELKQSAEPPYGLEDVFQAVTRIRSRKLPDVKAVPSVGSFFINPVVSRDTLIRLQKEISDLQFYPVEQLQYVDLDDKTLSASQWVKIPVGRLLDELGWKGKQIGNCMVYEKWASIITHNGKATGEEILTFTNTMAEDVYNRYGIKLTTEVTIL